MHKIFSAAQLGSRKIATNRLAVAPMTTQQSETDGAISPAETAWLQRLSQDGYGIVISCAASISDTATAFYNQLSLAHDKFIPALKDLSEKMRTNNSLNIIQLCHAGSRAIEALTKQKPHSASSYTLPMIPDFEPPLALSKSEINAIIADFAAAVRAEKAGFDGIELHGANGYLFTQFISKMTNLREDNYGGSLANRARLAREVVHACRQKVSEDFIIGFRLSFEGGGMDTGLDLDENIQIANWLREDGIDYIHSSQMDYSALTNKYPSISLINYLRKNIHPSLPLVIPGQINSLAAANTALALGADIVAIGRAAIGNKSIPALFSDNIPVPLQTPFKVQSLRNIGISEAFIDYIQNAPPLKSLSIVRN